ncbi:MAG: hypothetical protein IIB57_12570 [Planctomycetes bacterium]|nr:hypothetical protein [Planctomycetota bacterium]
MSKISMPTMLSSGHVFLSHRGLGTAKRTEARRTLSRFVCMAVCAVLAVRSLRAQLPECTIDFEGDCPETMSVCDAMFDGGDGCLFEGLFFCYSSGAFSYKVTLAPPLTTTLLGDLYSLEVFFAGQRPAPWRAESRPKESFRSTHENFDCVLP